MSEIVLKIDGKSYVGWKSIDATISMENLSGQFSVEISDNIANGNKPVRALPTIRPGLECEVYINDQVIITGYIDKVMPVISAENHTIVVQGRDKTGDLVDCSMTESTNQYLGLKIDQITKRICSPFGIPVKLGDGADAGAIFDNFLIEQGSTCFEAIQKLCYMRQLLAISDGRGGLLLTKSGTEKITTGLFQGVNIKQGEASYDFSERFSYYICKGQKQGDDNSTPETVANNSGAYTDEVVPRYRPLLVIAEGQADISTCTKRAKWEGAIRRGKSRRFTITVNGWSLGAESIWEINKLVQLKSELLGVDDTLLISQVNFKLDNNGEITVLTLTSPESFTIDGRAATDKVKTNPYLVG